MPVRAPDRSLELTRRALLAGAAALAAPSIARAQETAPAAWIVFPRWAEGAALSLGEMPKSEGCMQLATNAFNYEILGEQGFATARDLIDGARCYRLVYSSLDEAVEALGALAIESGA